MTQRHFLPDFLLIPYQLIADERVNPLDEKVYAVLYWMERLRGGECNPSNDEISRIVHADTLSDSRSVQNSLTKLDDLGYITRVYADTNKRTRTAIRTNLSFRGNTDFPIVGSKDLAVIATPEDEETPRDFAKRFMARDREAIKEIGSELLRDTGLERAELMAIISEFISYWTEPNGSGKKVRWELERTFEVRRRLGTWLSRRRGIKTARRGNVV